MNRVYAAAAALLVGLSFWAGWEWRDRSADLADSRKKVAESRAETAAHVAARTAEHEQADKLAAIGAKHEEDRASAPSVADAVVADLRADRLRLRREWAGCETQRLSEASAAAVERDALAQRREQLAGEIVRIGRDADDHVRACQAVIRADRS